MLITQFQGIVGLISDLLLLIFVTQPATVNDFVFKKKTEKQTNIHHNIGFVESSGRVIWGHPRLSISENWAKIGIQFRAELILNWIQSKFAFELD